MLNEKLISNFYGTDVYMSVNSDELPNVIARHEFDEIKEKCLFNIDDGNIISGAFSDSEKYEDVREWISINKIELLDMWKNDKWQKAKDGINFMKEN